MGVKFRSQCLFFSGADFLQPGFCSFAFPVFQGFSPLDPAFGGPLQPGLCGLGKALLRFVVCYE